MMSSSRSREAQLTSNVTYRLPSGALLIVGGLASFNGWGVSVFDAMDTMWIMGLHDMFREGVEIAAKSTFTLQEVCAPDCYPVLNPAEPQFRASTPLSSRP